MLFLVATPIGNLGDITQRALDTLREADVVVSEDTRKTGFLLTHFDIHKPQLSFREDNEERTLPKVLALLQENKKVALVTDAGTPGISDPGFILVRAGYEGEEQRPSRRQDEFVADIGDGLKADQRQQQSEG